MQNHIRLKPLVLIPGWATDHRIFSNLDLEYNYLVPPELPFLSFADGLAQWLRANEIEKVSLFGLSLGGFLAGDFCSKYPQSAEKVYLAGIRRQYPKQDLDRIRVFLKRNKSAYLGSFYRECFPNHKDWQNFRNTLLESYLNKFSLEYLLPGLDYLEVSRLKPEAFKDIKKIEIYHGQNDKIAPIQEAAAIAKNLAQAEFISLKNKGHIPF